MIFIWFNAIKRVYETGSWEQYSITVRDFGSVQSIILLERMNDGLAARLKTEMLNATLE